MKKIFLSLISISFLLTAQAFAADALFDRLTQISGARIQEINSQFGYRVFEIKFQQPADHNNPTGEQFEQRLILWHKNETRPMVLQTSGYKIFGISLAALAADFDANQIQVEHRFFDTSTPTSRDWSLDTIEQSAHDFHRITEAFKLIYTGKWVNTGRSKGGMTSVYHRRFFPNDVDATVAHVAPQSYSTSDSRYADFVTNYIGGDENAQCRAKLIAVQRKLLNNRNIVLNTINGSFNFLSSKEIAMEHAIIELPWSFWQYSSPTANCSNVPSHNAPLAQHIAFLNQINSPSNYTDDQFDTFSPYYYQAATQLGNPETPFHAIADLLNFEDTFNVFNFVPKDSHAVYDNSSAMLDIKDWVAQQSSQMLFVYGQWDPWSGGPFEPNANPESDSHIFYVPKTNHSAQYIDLRGDDRAIAYNALRKWLNIENQSSLSNMDIRKKVGKTLEDIEFEAIKARSNFKMIP